MLSVSVVPLPAQTSTTDPRAPSSSQDSFASNELLLMFWNLENFFDYIDGGASESDKEFSAHGTRHWSKKKFQAKCAAIAKTLMWTGDREGRMPDVFAVAEVENRYVLRQLNEGTMIRKYGYQIVHYDSPDPRGIDVALLYRPQSLELLESRPVRVHGTLPAGLSGTSAALPSGTSSVVPQGTSILVTRDILMTKFRVPASGDTLAVLVNHHPSKYGGGDTDWRREAALARLKALKDSLVAAGVTKVIATGDFNDVPENTHFPGDVTTGSPESFTTPFINLAAPLSARGEGTIRFDGKWQLIDMFLVTPALLGDPSVPAGKESARLEMEILHPPFLTVRDNVHSGDKPLRTYSGPRYIGGVSDHRPVILHLGVGAGSAERESASFNGSDGGSGESNSDADGSAKSDANGN